MSLGDQELSPRYFADSVCSQGTAPENVCSGIQEVTSAYVQSIALGRALLATFCQDNSSFLQATGKGKEELRALIILINYVALNDVSHKRCLSKVLTQEAICRDTDLEFPGLKSALERLRGLTWSTRIKNAFNF